MRKGLRSDEEAAYPETYARKDSEKISHCSHPNVSILRIPSVRKREHEKEEDEFPGREDNKPTGEEEVRPVETRSFSTTRNDECGILFSVFNNLQIIPKNCVHDKDSIHKDIPYVPRKKKLPVICRNEEHFRECERKVAPTVHQGDKPEDVEEDKIHEEDEETGPNDLYPPPPHFKMLGCTSCLYMFKRKNIIIFKTIYKTLDHFHLTRKI